MYRRLQTSQRMQAEYPSYPIDPVTEKRFLRYRKVFAKVGYTSIVVIKSNFSHLLSSMNILAPFESMYFLIVALSSMYFPTFGLSSAKFLLSLKASTAFVTGSFYKCINN